MAAFDIDIYIRAISLKLRDLGSIIDLKTLKNKWCFELGAIQQSNVHPDRKIRRIDSNSFKLQGFALISSDTT